MMAEASCAKENHETRSMVCCTRHLREFCNECAPPEQHATQTTVTQTPPEEESNPLSEPEVEQQTEQDVK